jgi:hypothetical protein
MSPRRGDDRFGSSPASATDWTTGTPRLSGEGFVVETFALFDIVDLDEGTCGRRPRV